MTPNAARKALKEWAERTGGTIETERASGYTIHFATCPDGRRFEEGPTCFTEDGPVELAERLADAAIVDDEEQCG